VLLDLADNAVLRRRVAGWRDRVDLVTAVPAGTAAAQRLVGSSDVLVRPDGYVAWAAPGSHADLPMALERWFGPAR
jgi:bifunctional hydroxylase/dehydrase